MKKVTRLGKMYKNTKVPSSFELNYAVTLCNYQVLEIIMNILNGNTPSFSDFIANYLTLLKYTETMTDMDAESMLQGTLTDVDGLLAEVEKKTFDLEGLCFYIGVYSESTAPHTLHTRFIVVLTMATLLGEKFEF